MDFGLLMLIRNLPKWYRPDHEVYRSYIDRAVRGEQLGFSHVWTSEHHFSEGAWSPSQFPILTAIAARTTHIRVGTYVLLLPLHNPIRAAEDAATVDLISNGRLDLGVGPGGRPTEHATFGIPFKQRRARMYEGLEILEKCFYEESFSYQGKYWNFNDVRMTTKPVQKRVPIWVAAIGPRALAEAGRRGYHLAGGGPADRQRIYETALQAAGHDPKNFMRANLHIGHLAETTDKAWEEAGPYMQEYVAWQLRMNAEIRALGLSNNVQNEAEEAVPSLEEIRRTGRGPYAPAYVGSPEHVIGMLEEELKVNPQTQIIWSMGLPGQDPRQADRSVELFAKDVMPHFRR
jgi:alkanesulfonate monooxygenase SsuD/methylene tetrahydromethanopterin reductase-like flavin-dependent oxidoreductase (luciferase family)